MSVSAFNHPVVHTHHSSPALLLLDVSVSCLEGEIRVQRDSSLDYELSPQMELVVLADNGLQTTHCRVCVNLLDVNDNTPVFDHGSYRTAVWEGQVHNTYVMQVGPSSR